MEKFSKPGAGQLEIEIWTPHEVDVLLGKDCAVSP